MAGSTRFKKVLAKDVTTTGPQKGESLFGSETNEYAIQVTITGTGTVSSTVYIEVSNDEIGWIRADDSNIAVSGSNVATNGLTLSVPWQNIRANVTALSGTDAKVTVTIGG
jgi:hypothetical protein